MKIIKDISTLTREGGSVNPSNWLSPSRAGLVLVIQYLDVGYIVQNKRISEVSVWIRSKNKLSIASFSPSAVGSIAHRRVGSVLSFEVPRRQILALARRSEIDRSPR